MKSRIIRPLTLEIHIANTKLLTGAFCERILYTERRTFQSGAKIRRSVTDSIVRKLEKNDFNTRFCSLVLRKINKELSDWCVNRKLYLVFCMEDINTVGSSHSIQFESVHHVVRISS